MSNESTQLVAHPSMARQHPVWFVVTLILCVGGIGFLILIPWWLSCRATTLTVTNQRTILRTGLLSKSLTEVWHSDVRNVQLHQGVFDRMFGVGNIGVSSAGQAGMEIVAGGLPDPERIKSCIDHYKRNASLASA